MVEVKSASNEDEAEVGLEAQRRHQLMRATMECVAEVGVEKTTMWMVAKRAGVSTGMVLYYYPNKRELITSAVKLAAQDFSARLQSLAHGEWGLERLRESVEVFLSESAVVPRNFFIQYRMAALNDPEIRSSSLNTYETSRIALSRSVRAAQAEGQIGAETDPFVLADLLYTLANGLAAEIAAHPEIMSPERAAEVAQHALGRFVDSAGAARHEPGLPMSQEFLPHESKTESTADAVRLLLLQDKRLDERTAQGLASAFRSMYEVVATPES
jgi:AcrR family transcriptional regulator